MLICEVRAGTVLAEILTKFGWVEIRNGQQKMRLEMVESSEIEGAIQVLFQEPGEDVAPPKPEETLYDGM